MDDRSLKNNDLVYRDPGRLRRIITGMMWNMGSIIRFQLCSGNFILVAYFTSCKWQDDHC